MSSVMGPPEGFCLDLSLRVRSPLIAVQLCPASVDLKTISAEVYSVLGSCGEMNRGSVHWKRCRSFSAPLPETSSGQTEMSTSCSVRLSKREMKASELANVIFGSVGYGAMYPH